MTAQTPAGVEGLVDLPQLTALLERANLPWARADWSCDDGPDRWTIEASQPDPRVAQGFTSVWPDAIQKIRVAKVDESDDPEFYGDLIVAAVNALPALIAELTAARERLAGEAEATAWLIEHGSLASPMYWSCVGGWGRWDGNHHKAIRFARRQDAFTVSLALGDMPNDPPHRIVEHKWISK